MTESQIFQIEIITSQDRNVDGYYVINSKNVHTRLVSRQIIIIKKKQKHFSLKTSTPKKFPGSIKLNKKKNSLNSSPLHRQSTILLNQVLICR